MRFILLIFLLPFTLLGQSVAVTDLQFEHNPRPLGVGETEPRLSWKLLSDQPNTRQAAYQLQVAASESALREGDLVYDGERVASDQSVLVAFPEEGARTQVQRWWRVRAWTDENTVTPWSEPAHWEYGLLDSTDWSARWIEAELEEETDRSMPAPLLRRDFTLEKPIASARLYITSHGLYEAAINGERVGDLELTPGWTAYDDRLQYFTYDVTELLQEGGNAIGVKLGDGWFRGYLAWKDARNHYGTRLALLAQLDVTYADGSRERIGTDGSWRAGTGAIRSSDIYNGVVYDARMAEKGFAEAGFDDSGWSGVREVDHPLGRLVEPVGPAVRVTETRLPIEQIITPEGDTVLDFGQNLVGRVRFTVDGPAGQRVEIGHAEVLDKEGNFYTANLREARQEIDYTLAGGGAESFSPSFTFMGFRYIRVRGWPGELNPTDFRAEVLHSAMRPTGSFSCSDSLINQLQRNIQWGQRGNFVDVPTDCPQRDERLGWTGDAQAFASTAAFNYDVAGFFRKWLQDLAADQRADGAVPHVIPNVLGKDAAASAGWADAATIVPTEVYAAYGDRRMLEEQYPAMRDWVDYIAATINDDDLWTTGWHFGDWLFFSRDDDTGGWSAVTDRYLTAQSFAIYSTDLLVRAARTLGEDTDVATYDQLSKRLREAYLEEYVTPGGRLASNTQTAYVLALHFNLLPQDMRQQAADRLVENIDLYGHLTTGFLGTPYLLEELARHGHLATAYRLLERTEYPSWLYPVTRGATTIWERWNGIQPDSTFQAESMNSFNHYAYGAVGDFLYRYVAGLDQVPGTVGHRRLRIQPHPGGSLTAAEARLLTPYGPASSGWVREGDEVVLTVMVPPNANAEIVPPPGSEPIDDEALQKIGSGTHTFRFRMAQAR
jgi:alpha-L-rhamnosidase